MPASPDPWTKNPFGREIADGKMFGLGSYDMKAGLAASIMTVKALNDLGIQLKGDLMVESVVDEEFGGANGTLAARLKYNADLAVVPEPTNLVVCPAHHGGMMLRVTFQGKPGWGFSPDKPIDPVSAIGRFIKVLNDWTAQRNATVRVPEIFRENHNLPVLVNSPTPMVLLGPTGQQPHSPDEFVYVEDYLDLVEVFVRGAIEWCGV